MTSSPVYGCTTCSFESSSRDQAETHVTEMNKSVRSKWWKHELVVKPPKLVIPHFPCPICRNDYIQKDLSSHLWTQHRSVQTLIDCILSLEENVRMLEREARTPWQP